MSIPLWRSRTGLRYYLFHGIALSLLLVALALGLAHLAGALSKPCWLLLPSQAAAQSFLRTAGHTMANR